MIPEVPLEYLAPMVSGIRRTIGGNIANLDGLKGGSAPATTLGAIFCTAAVRTFLAYACLQMFNLETPDRLGFLEAETIVTA